MKNSSWKMFGKTGIVGGKILDCEINVNNFQLKNVKKYWNWWKISNRKIATKNSVGRWVEKIEIICEKILSPSIGNW